MEFSGLVLELNLPQNFCHTDAQTDKHFPEILKSCPGHLKTCKSIKILQSKMLTKPILTSIYAEESKENKCPEAQVYYGLSSMSYLCLNVLKAPSIHLMNKTLRKPVVVTLVLQIYYPLKHSLPYKTVYFSSFQNK